MSVIEQGEQEEEMEEIGEKDMMRITKQCLLLNSLTKPISLLISDAGEDSHA